MNDDRPPMPPGGPPPRPYPESVQAGPPPQSPLPDQIQVGLPPLPGQVLMEPAPRPSLPPAPAKAAHQPGPGDMKDGTREIVETIVFVVVLVLLLKTFVAEAFVIPTGSMATTLLGYHIEVTCEKCGIRFLANASKEADPAESTKAEVVGARCENCWYLNKLRPFQPPPEGDAP